MTNKTLKQQIEETRAGATKPSCFQDILDLQKKLDKILEPRQTRPRTLTDICLSAIAECIEFNEETKESHKTWKEKPFNEVAMKKEAIDILFFFAQMLNAYYWPAVAVTKIWKVDCEDIFKKEFFLPTPKEINKLSVSTRELIELFSTVGGCMEDLNDDWYTVERIAMMIRKTCNTIGMDYEEILERYWDKWNENLDRIGSEWN